MARARRGVAFSALGPLEIRVAGELLALQSTQLRVLAAALLVSRNEVVSTDRLVDAIWTGRDRSPPRDVVAALHTLVHRFRAALGDGSGEGDAVVVTRTPGYLLETDAAGFDVLRFEAAVDSGRRAARSGDAGAAVSAFDDALTLWRGPAFVEFVYDDFARVEAARLEDARLVAIEERSAAMLALGRHAELVGELEGVVATHPYRERMAAALMLCLYRAGRQADALRAFSRLRSTLGEELGIEPSLALRELETAMVRQENELDWVPDARAAESSAMPTTPRPTRSSVPIALSEIFGREDAVADAVETLANARVVTLTGPPGVGKTRLAAEVINVVQGRHDRVVWCELAGVSEPDVARAIATALAVRPERGEDVLTAIVDALWSEELLMIVDNCEHALDAVAAVVEAIEHACGRVRFLATSREALGVEGEVVRNVVPLELAAAVELFATRARAAREDFRLDDLNCGSVERICSRLDRVPLAIELAAARVTTFAPAELADRLDDRFSLLSAGRRTAALRHQSLRAAIDWSYDLLDPEDQRVLRCLGVFRGGFSIEAAEAVAAEDWASTSPVWSRVDDLVRRSLVSVDAADGKARVRLLETVREYAFERLGETDEADVVIARHARYFGALIESAAEMLTTAAEVECTARVDRELDNITIALDRAIERGDLDVALGLVSQAGEPVFSWATGFNQAIDRSAMSAVRLARAAEHPRFPAAAAGVSWLACDRSDMVTAAHWADEALAAEARLGTSPPLFYPWVVRANLSMYAGDVMEAVQHWAHAVDLMREQDAPALAAPLSFLASMRSATGDPGRGVAEAEEAVEMARVRGAPGMLAIALGGLGINTAPTDPARAIALIRESVDVQRSVGHSGAGRALVMAMTVAVRYGSPDEALALVADVLAENQRPMLTGMALTQAAALIAAEQPAIAALLLGAADAQSRLNVNMSRPWLDERGVGEAIVGALGAEREAALHDEGAAMDRAAAVAVAQAAIARAMDRQTAAGDS